MSKLSLKAKSKPIEALYANSVKFVSSEDWDQGASLLGRVKLKSLA